MKFCQIKFLFDCSNVPHLLKTTMDVGEIFCENLHILIFILVVLWPSQHIKVMSSMVSYPINTVPG